MPSSKQSYFDAYADSIDELLKYPGVVGVGLGPKLTKDGVTHTEAIVVLVASKLKSLPEEHVIPAFVNGFPTDVREIEATVSGRSQLTLPDGRQLINCHGDYKWTNWEKIHELNQTQQKGNDGVECEVRGNFFIIKDPKKSLVTNLSTFPGDGQEDANKKTLDFLGAYRLFRQFFKDHYDFDVGDHYHILAYYIDVDSGLPKVGNASTLIHNEVEGIGLRKFDHRAQWDQSKSLLHVLHYSQFTLRSMLHEVGHMWLAYADYLDDNDETSSLLHRDFPADELAYANEHWGGWVDDGLSCMDYDRCDWKSQDDGSFLKIDRKNNEFFPYGRDGFGYSPLDLYLMGLIPAADVPDWRIVRDPMLDATSGQNNRYSAKEASYIGVRHVQALNGPRNPDHMASQRIFHQATIVLTAGGSQYEEFISTSESWRKLNENNFRRATGGRAILDSTVLFPGFDDVFFYHSERKVDAGAAQGDFWKSPDLWVRRNNDRGTDHEEPLRGPSNFICARIHNSSTTSYRNLVINFYLFDAENQAAAREGFLYPCPDARFIGQQNIGTLPPTDEANQAPTVVQGWRIEPGTYKYPFLICEILPLATAPLQTHRVWENKKLAQREVQIPPS
jgi:hypothetical protein